MKTLSKLMALAFTATALLFTSQLKAQTTAPGQLRFSIGPDAGYPTGNLTIGSVFVLGGNARLQYGLSNSFAITLTSGADHFFSKINPATGKKFDSFGIIPIKAGFKIFFLPNIYFGGETGIGIEETDSGEGNKKFILTPALGVANKQWDIAIRYENFSGGDDPYGFVVLRVAYGFAL
jgi:hypothetical protein